MKINNKALIISTSKLSGFDQMKLDLYFLDEAILNSDSFYPEILLLGRRLGLLRVSSKEIPAHWENLCKRGFIRIVRRPSGGGAVLHSGGITYALTFKKLVMRVLDMKW